MTGSSSSSGGRSTAVTTANRAAKVNSKARNFVAAMVWQGSQTPENEVGGEGWRTWREVGAGSGGSKGRARQWAEIVGGSCCSCCRWGRARAVAFILLGGPAKASCIAGWPASRRQGSSHGDLATTRVELLAGGSSVMGFHQPPSRARCRGATVPDHTVSQYSHCALAWCTGVDSSANGSMTRHHDGSQLTDVVTANGGPAKNNHGIGGGGWARDGARSVTA